MAFNLLRAAGVLGGGKLATAVTATVPARGITLPARISRTARHARLHLPLGWPWATAYQRLFTATATGPPPGA